MTFVELYERLDETTEIKQKVALMASYFRDAPPADSAWTFYLLSGKRLKNLAQRGFLREVVSKMTGVPLWLVEECYTIVGDSAETLAKILPEVKSSAPFSIAEWMLFLQHSWPRLTAEQQEVELQRRWSAMDSSQRFVFNKCLTGAFRVGVSRDLALRALHQATGIAQEELARRTLGDWSPEQDWDSILDPSASHKGLKPFPFLLAHGLSEADFDSLDIRDFQVEWKWDGIRAQALIDSQEIKLWSRGEDYIHASFPDVTQQLSNLPAGTVLDGEILAFREGVLPFQELQKRLGRKSPTSKVMQETPCQFLAFDILSFQGEELRECSLQERRAMLEKLEKRFGCRIAPVLDVNTWDAAGQFREEAKLQSAEGLMIKLRESRYVGGRPKGVWFKWKVEPMTLDVVLIYAQRGSGRRAGLYSDFTFAIWKGEELVPIAKAYSGLTDAELAEVDRFVKSNTLESFGPVRSVKPELVFEIAFEGIQENKRTKSGFALRFPRIVRQRKDKVPRDASQISDVEVLASGPSRT